MFKNKAIWWVFLIIWITGSAYWQVCKIEKLCDAPIIITTIEPDIIIPPDPVLEIVDSNDLVLRAAGNFTFAKSSIMADKMDVYPLMDSLALYLAKNKKKSLTITGLYSSKEKNSTTFPDLGLARANEIKNWLISKRIPASAISIKSQLKNDLVFSHDSFKGGITFTFDKNNSFSDDDLANQQKFESIFKPLDLYFPTAGTQYIITSQNQKFISEAKKYISQNTEKNLYVTGHTDNQDSSEWNLALSKKRADRVKKQFVYMGISAYRIIVFGKGESEPKASNDTPAGKRANRRVTVIVK